MSIETHTQFLNYLAKRFNLQSYLEIGVYTGKNFEAITCPHKIGVDPDPTTPATLHLTSDQFFAENRFDWDLIFIDGDHEYEQVKRDFFNALRCLHPGGFIVLHDTCPPSRELTNVPRDRKGPWYGDTYKIVKELNETSRIDFATLDLDCGITFVRKDFSKVGQLIDGEITWDFFDANRKMLLRIVDLSKLP